SICFFFQAEDGIRDFHVTGVQTCALPISRGANRPLPPATPASISLTTVPSAILTTNSVALPSGLLTPLLTTTALVLSGSLRVTTSGSPITMPMSESEFSSHRPSSAPNGVGLVTYG